MGLISVNDTVKALVERTLRSISKEPHNNCVALYIHYLIRCLTSNVWTNQHLIDVSEYL